MCNICKVKSEYKESTRTHGRPPRKFFTCSRCGEDVQGVYDADGNVREFSTSSYRGGSHVVTLRLSDIQLTEFSKLGKTSREIFELGLETYKNSRRYLAK